MELLAAKLLLTPVLIAGATLVQRRRGDLAAGLVVGLPLTSGPVALILALDHGRGFAAEAAVGTLAGLVAEVGFCVVWAILAARCGWAASALAATAAFAAVVIALRPLPGEPWPTLAALLAALAAGRMLVRAGEAPAAPRVPPRWDLLGRIVVATLFVLGLTAIAGALGPRLSGLVSPLPIYAGVLVGFTHAAAGPAAARTALCGVLAGLFAFGAFFMTLALALPDWPVAPAFAAAIAAALITQLIVIAGLRHDARGPARRGS